MLPDEIEIEFGGRFPEEARANRIQVAIVDLVVGPKVVDDAVTCERCAGKTQRKLVIDERDVDHGAHLAAAKGCCFGADHALEIVGRPCADDVDDAAGGVAAIERALRATKNFHTLDIEEFSFEKAVGGKRCAIEVHTGRGVAGHGSLLRADAANLKVVAAVIALGEGHVWNGQLQVGATINATLVQQVIRERGNGNWNILKSFLAPLRGNDNDIAVRSFNGGFRLLGKCRSSRKKADGRNACRECGTKQLRFQIHEMTSLLVSAGAKRCSTAARSLDHCA